MEWHQWANITGHREGGEVSRFVSNAGLAVIVVLATRAGSAQAQFGRQPSYATQNWVAGGVTVNQGFTLHDGVTDSQWAFDSGTGYWASIEHPTQNGILVGVQGSFATPILLYTTNTASGAVDCTAGCAATGTVRQFMGLIKSGNSYGAHPVIEATAGAMGFSNFKQQTTNTPLGPATTKYDFSFALGYGLGFSLSPTSTVEIIQEIGTVMHSTSGLPVGSRSYPRLSVTRIGWRFAF
jgi:hypothetical protein